jgi:alpha-tubulin suppressor-like RCC1 family protein/predicted Ser/Thr protein kinase
MLNAEPAPAALDALAEDYEIIRELGRGGTAVVFLARERATGDDVAIKLVRAQFADDDEARARLAREARFVTQLDHPNVVPVRTVLDLGDNGVALVMSHVPGRTLREILRDEGPLAPERTASVLRDVASALGAAHGMGIVHRDVKPENVFITDDERAVLADFGIARSMSAEAQQLTMHGVAIGTPAYMAPEQIDGEDLDARTDIYSLGLLGWEMLTGKRPFAGEALYSVLYHQKHVQLDDPRTRLEDVPPALVSALAGAVEKERDARWTSAHVFLSALEGKEEPHDWPASEPVATATVRVDRAPPEPESVVAIDWRQAMDPAPLASPWPSFTRRQVAFGSGIGALAVLALVVGAVRTHSRDLAAEQREVSNGAISVNDAPRSVALPTTSALAVAATDSSRTIVTDTRAPRNQAATSTAAPLAPAVTTPPTVAAPAPAVDGGPAPAAARSRVRVAVGGRHSCLLAEDGRAYCWGGNDRGQLGIDNTSRLTAPLSPVGTGRFTVLASGMSHSCALGTDGDAYCWGDNDAGQLGDGTNASHEAPARVTGSHDFRSISAGSAHACALATNGTAWCWGSDVSGQLGDRGNGNRPSPVPVAGDHRFSMLAAGWSFTCALDTDAQGWCWGSDSSGELGDSGTVNQRVPVRVGGGRAFTSIAAGSAHACATADDGSAWCWGSNSSGQLGDGTSTTRLSPVRVRSNERFTSITAGAVHSCALSANGDAWCWGSNVYGQLGNDSNTDSPVPVRVAGGHSFTSLRAFGSHDCGVTSAGETFCWGYNLDGQLGDGTRTHRSRPVYVQRPGVS